MRKIVKGIVIITVTILVIVGGCELGRYMTYLDVDKRIESWDDETLFKAYVARCYGIKGSSNAHFIDADDEYVWFSVIDPVYGQSSSRVATKDHIIEYIKENWE